MKPLDMTDFYPKRFSMVLDAFVWLAVFLGGLAFASSTMAGQWMPSWVWATSSIIIYVVIGCFYAMRKSPQWQESERVYNWTWIGCINMAMPFFLVLMVTILLWLAGAITFMTASWLAIGALVTAVLGPLLTAIAMVSLVIGYIWMDSRVKSM